MTMTQTLRARLAENVKKYRMQLGYRREALSLVLGWDNSYISKLEKAQINITLDKLEQLAAIFKVDVVDLFA